MSTVSQFLALASGSSSGGGLSTFREVYQNTDNPYAYTTSAPVVVNLSTASSIYDMQTVTPGVPAIVHDTTVTNDIVRYITVATYDVHNGYAVAQATKETLTATSTVYVLINLLTGSVKELALPVSGGASQNLFAFVIGFDGFLYYVDNAGTGGSYVAGGGGGVGVANKPLRIAVYSLSTALQAGSTFQSTYGVMQAEGGSSFGSSRTWLHFARPSTANTGHITIFSSGVCSRNDLGSVTSAVAVTKIDLNGASTSASTVFFDSASGGGTPNTSPYTSGQVVSVNASYTGVCQGGFLATITRYSFALGGTEYDNTLMLLDETRETAQLNSQSLSYSGGPILPSFPNSTVILKDGTTLAALFKYSSTQFRVAWAGDTTMSRIYTVTMGNPSLDNQTAGQMDICQQYGTYKNRFICGNAVYTINATAKTVTFNKTLFSVPGNNTLLQAPGSRSWTKVYYVTNSVSGQITQLYLDGVDVNSADPTIIGTTSGSPVGFQSAAFAGFTADLQFSLIGGNVAAMNGVTSTGHLSTQYGTYATVSGERFTRAWTGITSGSTITAPAPLSLNARIPYMSGSNYVNATLKSQLVGSVARFDKVRFTVRLPAYTNTSTGASTILIRILANSNEIKNMKIVNTTSQDVYIHSATQIGVRLNAATNMVAEDVVIEADTFIRFTGGGLLVNSTTYAPLTGTVTLTLSNLIASPRLMGELFQ